MALPVPFKRQMTELAQEVPGLPVWVEVVV
jgi:hypothetical protein